MLHEKHNNTVGPNQFCTSQWSLHAYKERYNDKARRHR